MATVASLERDVGHLDKEVSRLNEDRKELEAEVNQLRRDVQELRTQVGEKLASSEDLSSMKMEVQKLLISKAEQGPWWTLLEKFGNLLLAVLLAVISGAIAFFWGMLQGK